MPAGAGGRKHGQRRRNLHLRHGQAGEDSGPGETHDQPVRADGREDRVHGTAPRREAVRGAAEREGADEADVSRENHDRYGEGV